MKVSLMVVFTDEVKNDVVAVLTATQAKRLLDMCVKDPKLNPYGGRVAAIKQLREWTGLHLKESMDIVNILQDETQRSQLLTK